MKTVRTEKEEILVDNRLAAAKKKKTFHNIWYSLEADLDAAGETIDSYIHHYGFGIIGHSLGRLGRAQLGKNREVWANEWALELANDNPQAQELDIECELSLAFLYKVIEKNLLSDFKVYRIDRIVRTCLVMIRAKALCPVFHFRTRTGGLYWFAEIDRFWMESLLEGGPSEIKRLRKPKAPLHQKIRALMEDKELSYKTDREILAWVRPCKEEGQDDDCCWNLV